MSDSKIVLRMAIFDITQCPPIGPGMGHAEQVFDFREAGYHPLVHVVEPSVHLVPELVHLTSHVGQPDFGPLESGIHLAELGPEEGDQVAILVRRHDLRATIHDSCVDAEVPISIH